MERVVIAFPVNHIGEALPLGPEHGAGRALWRDQRNKGNHDSPGRTRSARG